MNPELYTMGGTLHGLEKGVVKLRCLSGQLGRSLKKRYNKFDENTMDVTVSANGRFQFPYKLSSNRQYDVTVLESPKDQRCDVSRGTGAVVFTPSALCTSFTPFFHHQLFRE